MLDEIIPGSGMEEIVEFCAQGGVVELVSSNNINTLVDRLCYSNFRQWKLENAIRESSIKPRQAFDIIKAIHASNEERTWLIEKIDRYYENKRNSIQTITDCNSEVNLEYYETLGQILDILSILFVRKYHMKISIAQGTITHLVNNDLKQAGINAIIEQIQLCERCFIRIQKLYLKGLIRLPPLYRFKLYKSSLENNDKVQKNK